MDARRFDCLTALLSVSGARRRSLILLAAMSIGGLLAAPASARSEAGRRGEAGVQRKKRKRKKRCKKSKICASRCGVFQGKCKKPVTCDDCPVCQNCEANQCVPDEGANRDECGSGNICCNGVCCDGCCDVDGDCGACLAFTSSSTHDGDLDGLIGADQICQDLADNAPSPLPGTYKAWLSTGTGADESPSDRFRRSERGYVRVDGVVIADSFADLTDGTIDNPIFVMEDGEPVPPPSGNVLVWTNTGADGTEFDDLPFDCDNWTSALADLTGRIGMTDPIVTDANWTELGSVQFCDATNLRLYCFQQV